MFLFNKPIGVQYNTNQRTINNNNNSNNNNLHNFILYIITFVCNVYHYRNIPFISVYILRLYYYLYHCKNPTLTRMQFNFK